MYIFARQSSYEDDSELKPPVTHHQREGAAANVLQSVNNCLNSIKGEVADIKWKSAAEKISSLSLSKSA